MKLQLILAAASMLLVSCAPTPGEGEDADARVFRTGSHLPQRDNQVPTNVSTQGKPINTTSPVYVPASRSN
jgi:hypothetical protein